MFILKSEEKKFHSESYLLIIGMQTPLSQVKEEELQGEKFKKTKLGSS